jgi:phage-related protein
MLALTLWINIYLRVMDEGALNDDLVCDGAWGSIRYAKLPDGSMPAKEYLESLDEKDLTRVIALMQRMADVGRICNTEQFRKLDDGIWEFKRGPVRILCFQRGNGWVLTHGYKKQSQRLPASELKRAKRIMESSVE